MTHKIHLHRRKSLSRVMAALTAIPLSWAFAAPSSAAWGPGTEACSQFFEDFEQTVDSASVHNDASFRVPGYPFLRTSRFLNALRYFVTDREERRQWLDLLYQEGSRAVGNEIENLPDAALARLRHVWHRGSAAGGISSQDLRESLKKAAEECADLLLLHAEEDPGLAPLSFGIAEVPSEYRAPRRILGFYPLFTPAIGTAIAHYKRNMEKRYALPLDALKPRGRLVVLFPAGPSGPEETGTAEKSLEAASKNPLGIPLLEDSEFAWMIRRYAPVFEQDVTGDYDLPGAVEWQGSRIAVNPREATVYYYATYALHRGVPLLQLNYVLWYMERPPVYLLDIEAGRIHGMTLRITIDRRGEPIMVDAIHNCGCYHFFFPSRDVYRAPRTELLREDAFVPQWLPPFQDGQSLAVRIETKRHRVERLFYQSGPLPDQTPYRLIPYDILERLPRESGRKESIFDPEGIVKGDTERPERFPLFSVGIPEIGSMRQRAHHATALIGERTFDDPRLFERFFILD